MEVVNRVVQSGIVVYDLESLWKDQEIRELDLSAFLEHGFLLREESFREQVKASDWEEYAGLHVALYCNTDALIPMWAYMLIASHLDGAASVTVGRKVDVIREMFLLSLEQEDWNQFSNRIVVVKGCGSGHVPESAYSKVIGKLQKVARKVMFGEPCSSVPIWRCPKKEPEE
ncbi:MAG: DUF2480 family protein [Bacteroidetes bacterium]|nr:DUF2480 family protein [Bacteroidota bacterium]